MKANEAMIAWTPRDAVLLSPGDAPAGSVMVGPWPDRTGWSAPYMMTTGACNGGWSKAAELLLFVEFVTLTVRDGIDPHAAHAAFCAVDGYRSRIAPDLPGAELAPGEWAL